jgi:hypothetical protein
MKASPVPSGGPLAQFIEQQGKKVIGATGRCAGRLVAPITGAWQKGARNVSIEELTKMAA